MEQERVSDGTKQGIHHLCITGRTQGGYDDGLSFTTGKHGGTVSGRQYACFDGQRTHGVVVTTVDTRLAFDHAVTHHFILQGANHVGDFVGRETFFAFFSGEFFNGGVFDFVQTGVTGHFRSEEHTSELQSRENLVCRLLLEKKNQNLTEHTPARAPGQTAGGDSRAVRSGPRLLEGAEAVTPQCWQGARSGQRQQRRQPRDSG